MGRNPSLTILDPESSLGAENLEISKKIQTLKNRQEIIRPSKTLPLGRALVLALGPFLLSRLQQSSLSGQQIAYFLWWANGPYSPGLGPCCYPPGVGK